MTPLDFVILGIFSILWGFLWYHMVVIEVVISDKPMSLKNKIVICVFAMIGTFLVVNGLLMGFNRDFWILI